MTESKLTAKQEAFALAVAIENMSYSEAYRKHYSARGKSEKTVWVNASKLAKSTKVSLRIHELKKQVHKEALDSISWDFKEAEKELRFVLNANKRAILLAERAGQPAKHANNIGMLGAIKQLTEMLIAIHKMTATTETVTSIEYEDDGLLKALNIGHEGLWDEENFNSD